MFETERKQLSYVSVKLPPIVFDASIPTTSCPASRSSFVVTTPLKPPPITHTRCFFFFFFVGAVKENRGRKR